MIEVVEGSTIEEEYLTYDETVAGIVEHIKANHANTLGMCACLKVCETCRPYRDAEAIIDELPAMKLSTQTAHTLMGILIEAGGIETRDIPEETETQDMPDGYTVHTTDAGRDALAQFDPATRFEQLIDEEPATYAQAYAAVLRCAEHGCSKADIEKALSGNIALRNPKQVYPGYFISKLETIGGLEWTDSWYTSEAGRHMLAQVG